MGRAGAGLRALALLLVAGCVAAWAVAPHPVILVARDGLHRATAASLKAREGGVQPVFLIEPAGRAKGTFLLFPGGGASHARAAGPGRYRLSANFLLRIVGRLTARGFAAAVVPHPSDLEGARIPDDFRLGDDHARDVAAVIDFLARRGHRRLFLLGTSRGTVSVGALALNLDDPRIRGVIFTASLADRGPLPELPLDRIRRPVLFVHHKYDLCPATTYAGARSLFAQATRSPRRRFVTVERRAEPISGPCRALSNHGFLGAEEEVADAIADWAEGREPPRAIR